MSHSAGSRPGSTNVDPGTPLDCLAPLPGYYPSRWPCECAGPRRQKLIAGPGLDVGPNETLRAHRRQLDDRRWPAMFVLREHGELYLQGGSQANQRATSYGWVERLDPVSLAPVARSPKLPSGGHNWCGAVSVHANGDLYMVNGRYAHRLSPDLSVVAERLLTPDGAHNGLAILPDGNILTKDIVIQSGRRSTFTLLDPDLRVVTEYVLPFNSVGRFSCDPQPDGITHLYVTSSTAIHRLVYGEGRLWADESWSASYALAGQDQSFAWDSTVGGGSVWFMDMGESHGLSQVLHAHPVGANRNLGLLWFYLTLPIHRLFGHNPFDRPGGAFGPPMHQAPQHVFRVSTRDADDRDVLTPFDVPGGSIVAPPLFDPQRNILVAFDLMNAWLGAWRYAGPGQFEPLWRHRFMNANQLTLYAETGELIADDCKPGRRWDTVVLDVETGREKARADTGCVVPTGMWYTPGFDRDFYTSTAVGGISRLFVVPR
jgi:hypothetical protein